MADGPRLSLSYEPPGSVLKAFRASAAPVRALVGPVQAGRKTCAVYDILLRAAQGRQRRWRWAAVAAGETGIEAALAAWHGVVPPGLGQWDPKGLRHKFDFAVGGGARDLDLQFLMLDRAEHRKRLATLEVSGLWLVNARELGAEAFEAALLAAGSWPLDEPPAPLVTITSRMPAEDHWLARRAEDGTGAGELVLFRQPGGRDPRAENLRVLGGPGFYRRLAAGRTAEWVRVYVDAEWGSGRAAGSLEDAIRKSYAAADGGGGDDGGDDDQQGAA